jgi:hypothetical protein
VKIKINDFSPPFVGLIIGMPVYVLMNMVNFYFQPEEVLGQLEAGNGNFELVFLIGKLISLFAAVFVVAGISFLMSDRHTPWPLRIVAIITTALSVTETLVYGYPLWFSIFTILCCIAATGASRSFILKFSN